MFIVRLSVVYTNIYNLLRCHVEDVAKRVQNKI